jgi:hypothetical protein
MQLPRSLISKKLQLIQSLEITNFFNYFENWQLDVVHLKGDYKFYNFMPSPKLKVPYYDFNHQKNKIITPKKGNHIFKCSQYIYHLELLDKPKVYRILLRCGIR